VITPTSPKNPRIDLIALMAWRSPFILITKGMYFTMTLLVGENTKFHLIFTLQSNLFTFVLSSHASLHYSRCLLGEKEKLMYLICKRPSSFYTKGCLKNV
jgi:hypothetical protein